MDIDISSLRNWLNDKLKDLSISDPSPLSQYILALVKKDRPENELIQSCNDQLQIFLQDNTSKFVEDLFTTLKSKSYVQNYKSKSKNELKPTIQSTRSHKRSLERLSDDQKYQELTGTQAHDSFHRHRRSHSSSSSSSSRGSSRRYSKRSQRRSRSPQRVRDKNGHTRSSNSPHGKSIEPSRGQVPILTLISPNKQPINCLLGLPPMPVGGFANQNEYFRNPLETNSSLWADGLNNSIEPPRHVRRNYSPPKNIISLISPKTENNSYEPSNPQAGQDDVQSINAIEYKPAPLSRQDDDSNNPRQPKCVLVTRLPAEMNDLRKLLDHFSKYGNVINVQTYFQGSESKAMVEFKTSNEASSALNTPEPVFSNRFIRVSPWFKGLRHNQKAGLVDARTKIGKRNFKPYNTSQIINNDNTKKENLTISGSKSRFRLDRGSVNIGSDQENSDYEELEKGTHLYDESVESNTMSYKYSNYGPKSIGSNFSQKKISNDKETKREQKSVEESAKWEKQKLEALKEHRERAAEMERAKDRKRKLNEIRETRLAQIRASLKSVLEECKSLSSSDSIDEDAESAKNKRNKLNEMLVRASQLKKELEMVQMEVESSNKEFSKRQKTNSESQKLVSVLTNVLDQNIVAERIAKLNEVKERISTIQKQITQNRTNNQPIQSELTKELLELKREFVNLETISSDDLKNSKANNFQSFRNQTKLDKRPRTVFIIGLNYTEIDDYLQRVSASYLHVESHVRYQYEGENTVQGLEPGAPLLEITFRTRDFAETAIRTLKNYRQRLLTMSFNRPVPENELSKTGSISKRLSTNIVEDVAVDEDFKLGSYIVDIPVSGICD